MLTYFFTCLHACHEVAASATRARAGMSATGKTQCSRELALILSAFCNRREPVRRGFESHAIVLLFSPAAFLTDVLLIKLRRAASGSCARGAPRFQVNIELVCAKLCAVGPLCMSRPVKPDLTRLLLEGNHPATTWLEDTHFLLYAH